MASLVAVTATEVGGFVGVGLARATVNRVDELGLAQSARSFAGSWVLFGALSMVALLVSAATSLRSRANGLAVGAIVGWFFVNFIALLIDAVSPMRYASVFHYFRPSDILGGRAFVADLLVLVAVAILALACALWWFARRDLTR